ncbi:MAG: hypothetical protein O3A20_09220 [Planctomycetota bacterium]|nr:hypothetical protein [Planctomycetota bacterium]
MNLVAYRAAHEACARADGADRAWLELSGPDARDFLQRVTSSDLRALTAGGGQWSALLDGKGHWISDLLLYSLPGGSEEEFGIDLPAARADAVAQRFDMLHFSERFELRRAAWSRMLLLGPLAERHLAGLGLEPPPKLGAFGASRADPLLLLRRPDRGVPAIEILGPEAELVRLNENLAQSGVPCIGEEARETLRIEAFVPRWGADFDQETTLPNSNEWRRASVSKGCYAGQEVVARINTYGEAPRQLCRLRSEGEEPAQLLGAELADADGRVLGSVTSWAWSPRMERGLGLGMLRRKAATDGFRLIARDAGAEVNVVVELPPKELG